MKQSWHQTDAEIIRLKVRDGYGKIATEGRSSCGSTPTCCASAQGSICWTPSKEGN